MGGPAGQSVAGEDLRVSGAEVRYPSGPGIEALDLAVPAGSVLAVLGPSGCGKSTLLRALAGLEQLSAGTIHVGEQRVDTLPTHRRGFALMFQDGQLFAHMSVAANIAYPLRLRHVPRAEVRARVAELLDLVGLAGQEDRSVRTLSGGERQRVALARALAVRPRVLLLDEPLSALDASLRERLATDLRQILLDQGTTAVMVTHDHEEAFAVADSLAVMREGRIVQTGSIEQVWREPVDRWTALFLGYSRVLVGEPATALLAAAGAGGAHVAGGPGEAVALRRSALVHDAAGPLEGRVLSARATPDLTRLVLDVEQLGEVDAVTALGERVAPGDTVRVRIEADRIARTRA